MLKVVLFRIPNVTFLGEAQLKYSLIRGFLLGHELFSMANPSSRKVKKGVDKELQTRLEWGLFRNVLQLSYYRTCQIMIVDSLVCYHLSEMRRLSQMTCFD